jgi:hypothetical protein
MMEAPAPAGAAAAAAAVVGAGGCWSVLVAAGRRQPAAGAGKGRRRAGQRKQAGGRLHPCAPAPPGSGRTWRRCWWRRCRAAAGRLGGAASRGAQRAGCCSPAHAAARPAMPSCRCRARSSSRPRAPAPAARPLTCSGVISAMLSWKCCTAALLTSTSRRPSSDTARRTDSLQNCRAGRGLARGGAGARQACWPHLHHPTLPRRPRRPGHQALARLACGSLMSPAMSSARRPSPATSRSVSRASLCSSRYMMHTSAPSRAKCTCGAQRRVGSRGAPGRGAALAGHAGKQAALAAPAAAAPHRDGAADAAVAARDQRHLAVQLACRGGRGG